MLSCADLFLRQSLGYKQAGALNGFSFHIIVGVGVVPVYCQLCLLSVMSGVLQGCLLPMQQFLLPYTTQDTQGRRNCCLGITHPVLYNTTCR